MISDKTPIDLDNDSEVSNHMALLPLTVIQGIIIVSVSSWLLKEILRLFNEGRVDDVLNMLPGLFFILALVLSFFLSALSPLFRKSKR